MLLEDAAHPACVSAVQTYETDSASADEHVDHLRWLSEQRTWSQTRAFHVLSYLSQDVAEMSVSARILLTCRDDLGDELVDWAWADYQDWAARWLDARKGCWETYPEGPCPWT